MSTERNGGWSFRTSRPRFEEGETILVYAGRYDEDREQLTVRIGDTLLYVDDADPSLEDSLVKVTVRQFDAERHEGRATLEDVLGTTGL